MKELTATEFGLGCIEYRFGPLRTVSLWRTAPGCDYVVAVLNGTGQRLARRANFSTLAPARRFAKKMLKDLNTPATGGVDTL